MKRILSIIALSITLFSCTNDEYLVDGGTSQQNVGTTTYEFFKAHNQLDTLALLIERADMIDEVNKQGTTFFAPNNLSIRNYVRDVLSDKRKLDPAAEFTIDDIPTADLKNMLGGYLIEETLDRSKLVKAGKVYTTFNGEERLVSLEPVVAYTGQLDDYPEYVFFTYQGGGSWDPTDAIVDDKKVRVRTSNLLSTNGVIHVLQGDHIFSNYKKQP